ncbi:roadblock/LC7 domain-containing protein [Spirillospora sp. NPDC048819]|uniref:roadblock/LC7 domain-containing protein n=1 Tax=Spirillospora sp. NPDC048819 TaxID=3155268 RepID=UPI0033FD3B73
MTIRPTSAAMPAPGPPVNGTSELGWLLEDFLAQVPGTQGAFLVARDGLVLTAARLTRDEADSAAAVASALYSAGGAAGSITSPPAGDVQQIIVQHATRYTILMSTPDQHPDLAAGATPTSGPAVVGCVLGVLAGPDAHTGLVGDRMAALIVSVAKHLVTATRTGNSREDARGADTFTTDVPVEGAGSRDEGTGDER